MDFFNIDKSILKLSERVTKELSGTFARIDKITEFNQHKVLAAFIKNKVSEQMFSASTGYGYGDRGRETLDRVLADALGAQDAIIRHSFTCGTHTLSVMLFGVLRPGDTLLCVTGTPYDTIHSVIGLRGEGQGSLKDFGINYRQVELDAEGHPDFEAIREALLSDKTIKAVYIQRSRGYALRDSLSVETIGGICDVVKQTSDALVLVDNCYGEFAEKQEPLAVGADLIAGSLIKNAGGGIAPSGGYIAGRRDLVELCSYRMTTPGLGREVGATLGHSRELFMGLFNAPHVVGEAMKTACFAAGLFSAFGYDVTPKPDEVRHDIIQTLCLRDSETLCAFCRGLQKGAPVDSFVVPEAWDMPGYDSKVIMSAGAFTLGSSIELSADAPLREPYAVWLQGGLNFHSAKLNIMLAAEEVRQTLAI